MITAAPVLRIFTWWLSALPSGVPRSSVAAAEAYSHSSSEPASDQPEFSVLDHPPDHVTSHRSALTSRIVAPVPVLGRGQPDLPRDLVLELVESVLRPPNQDAVRPLTNTHCAHLLLVSVAVI